MACEGCVQEPERRQPADSHAGYVRGMLFGIGVAVVGMAGYAGFTILTELYIDYVSLAAVPIALFYYHKAKFQSESVQTQQQQSTANPETNQDDNTEAKSKLSFGAAILQLLILGLASPFLELQDPLHGIIGLIILMVGIRIAWQITAGTRRAKIQGPYENSSAAAI